jgi:hypothetical protein
MSVSLCRELSLTVCHYSGTMLSCEGALVAVMVSRWLGIENGTFSESVPNLGSRKRKGTCEYSSNAHGERKVCPCT